jgi:hypothetical protein
VFDYFLDVIDESVGHTWSRQHVGDGNMHAEDNYEQLILQNIDVGNNYPGGL